MFALAFAESLAFISLLVPAWGALVLIGTLIRRGGLNFWPIWIAGSVGAALGDWLSYWIGLKLEHTRPAHLAAVAPPGPDPEGRAFIKKWGALGIFIGRFSGPLRASVPLVAGIFEMPFWRFQIANFSLGLRLGRGAADARRCHVAGDQVARQTPRASEKIQPGRPGPAEQLSSDNPVALLAPAAAPACATWWSCRAEAPLTPIARMTLLIHYDRQPARGSASPR